MTGGYEGECSLKLVGGHVIENSAHGGFSGIAAFFDPPDRHADHGPAHHGQVKRASAVAHPAAIFAQAHVQPLMQPVFDSPISSNLFNNILGTMNQLFAAGIKLHKENCGEVLENPAADLKRGRVKPKDLRLPEPAQFKALGENLRQRRKGAFRGFG
jgi:hypothetical protein